MNKKTKDSANLIATIIDKAEYASEYAVRDMLTDLMHYCDDTGKSFFGELHKASENYKEEVKEN